MQYNAGILLNDIKAAGQRHWTDDVYHNVKLAASLLPYQRFDQILYVEGVLEFETGSFIDYAYLLIDGYVFDIQSFLYPIPNMNLEYFTYHPILAVTLNHMTQYGIYKFSGHQYVMQSNFRQRGALHDKLGFYEAVYGKRDALKNKQEIDLIKRQLYEDLWKNFSNS